MSHAGTYFRSILACASVADIYSKAKRAKIMSLVRGRGNKSTELLAVRIFRECGIDGWRRHVPLEGRPDFVFRVARVAVFIDGCFWHMCPIHGSIPKANTEFWAVKLNANRARDRRVDRILRAKEWRVIRIWQHDLRQRPLASMRRVKRALERGFLNHPRPTTVKVTSATCKTTTSIPQLDRVTLSPLQATDLSQGA